jgi:phage shock protein A
MPTKNFPELLRDWESLLKACDTTAVLRKELDQARNGLAQILEEVKTLKSTQDSLEKSRQATTRRLREACEAGREAARRVRGFVKFRLGTKNEDLARFGIPSRTRKSGKVLPWRAG